MPAPHRRSCRHCIIAKRRCDLSSPCYRCRVRSLPCLYNDKPTVGIANQEEAAAEQHGTTTVPATHAIDDTSTTAADTMLPEASLPHFPDHQLDWNEIMGNIDDFMMPDQLTATAEVRQTAPAAVPSHIFQERVVYAVKQIKTWPLAFVEKVSTPFISMRTYSSGIPPAIQEALGVCSLYANRNPRNDHVIQQCVIQETRRLLQAGSSSFDSLGLKTRLSIVQALSLCRIILLFDGDITMRAVAEASQAEFSDLLDTLRYSQLEAYAETLEDSADSSIDHWMGLWERWLLSESVRRSLVVAYSIEGAYSFLKHGFEDDSILQDLSFCVQSRLWSASTLQQWRSAARNRPWLPARLRTWKADTAMTTPEDCDDLGIIITVLVRGMDFCRDWLGEEHSDRLTLVC